MELIVQAFLSSLYIYLMDEMHKSLNQFVSLEERVAVPDKQLDAAQLKLFAQEATMDKNYALADKYYLEVHYLILLSLQSKKAKF